jgi:hypothetical protein
MKNGNVTLDATDAFRKVYNGSVNFITPRIIRRGKAGRFYYELSSGKKIFGEGEMFGVTILDIDGLGKRHDLSRSFETMDEALEYIKALRGDEDGAD